MQKRLVRRLELELFLSQIEPHSSPDASLEQYTISPEAAATMLYIAAYTYDSIQDKAVLDLGCGTGRLALGAVFLGAKQAVGIDIDKEAIRQARMNSVRTGLEGKVHWIIGDIDSVYGSFDTVLQNPPFGVQKRGADRKFLEKALELGQTVFSLHKHPERDTILIKKLRANKTNIMKVEPSPFLKRLIEKQGGKITAVYAMVMTIPHMFNFHHKKKHQFIVDLYMIDKETNTGI
jgi:putative methylase